ncbi:hypothetical protein ABHN11_12995 [Brevibacillus centrosporus]|uniref:hypothetical protein n=1 Tax=Brevibacillus centrosporus TaxID=54910 RepID=UPI003D249746
MYFTAEERRLIIRSLSKSQRSVLHMFSRLSQKSYFANVLASYKGTERFVFDGFVDHGGVKKSVTCLCGKFLRYEFILKDMKNGQKISLGRTHFQRELDIPDHVARQVHKGIHQINIELDEILDKYWRKDINIPQSINNHIKKIELPEEIECLFKANLPLLNRHIEYLFDATKEYRQSSKIRDEKEELCEEFQQILNEKISYKKYIEEIYGSAIEEYLLRSKGYEHTYTIIDHLIKNYGLKNQMLYGQHALHKFFRKYIGNHPNYIEHKDYYSEFKHIANMSEKEKARATVLRRGRRY